MSLFELLTQMFIFIVVIPVLACFGCIFSAFTLGASILLAPIVCIISLFTEDPYGLVAEFYHFILKIAFFPINIILDLMDVAE